MNQKNKRKKFFTYLTRVPGVLNEKHKEDLVNKDLCRCSHVRTLHKNQSTFCVGRNWLMSNKFCPCNDYRPQDNLKYLELKYERSIP